MVLFLYVIMMLNLNQEAEPKKKTYVQVIAIVAIGLMLTTIVGALKGAVVNTPELSNNAGIGTVEALGKVLFGQFLLPFEVSSILFLSAMVGAVYLSKKNLQ